MYNDNFSFDNVLRSIYDIFLEVYQSADTVLGFFLSPISKLIGDVLGLPSALVSPINTVLGWFGLADVPLIFLLIGGSFVTVLIANLVKWLVQLIPFV